MRKLRSGYNEGLYQGRTAQKLGNLHQTLQWYRGVNITEFERGKAKFAFQFLEQEFGHDFLHYAYEQHEFYHYLINFDAWTYRKITWFAEALIELKDQIN